MKILFRFIFDNSIIYVPDGYVNEATVQEDFLEWVHNRPENIVSNGYSYNSEDFLEYLNTVVLKEVSERAYFIERNIDNFKKEKNMLVLRF